MHRIQLGNGFCQPAFLAWILLLACLDSAWTPHASAGSLRAGCGRSEITGPQAGPANDPLYAKAMVLEQDGQRYAIVTLDVVALERIGPLPRNFLADLRKRLAESCGIAPQHLLVNTSHCHGICSPDVLDKTVAAVEQGIEQLEPVSIAIGKGDEQRISENRRLTTHDGRQVDVRHAYPLEPDSAIAAAGPIDPEVGVLRLDRADGQPLAILYTFAIHPIQGVPSGANTADLTGMASTAIEQLSGGKLMAFFLQGCAGDINPVLYKDVSLPRHAELLGLQLAQTTLRAAWKATLIEGEPKLRWVQLPLELPRADLAPTIALLEEERDRLVGSIQPGSMNFKGFLPTLLKHRLNPEFPSADKGRYLRDQALAIDDFPNLDQWQRQQLERYQANIDAMERLTRVQTNLALLKMHHGENLEANSRTIPVELMGVGVGPWRMVTFPGELTVELGLAAKQRQGRPASYLLGYTNGYIYYAPTDRQLSNRGGAQEDSDCLLALGWQEPFERAVDQLFGQLE